MLRLHTLGRFELSRSATSGFEVISIQPKRLAVLAYLCVTASRGPRRRDTLLALFWPESSAEEARRALRQALYYLRNALGDGVLVSRQDESLEVRPGALWCDAVALETALEVGKPGEALELYRGDFLAGVHLPEVAAELEQWLDATRERLRAQAASAAWRVSEQAEAAGDRERSASAARRAVELQPDDEAGVRRLIELLHRAGDRLSALSIYQGLVERFAREYGAEPSAETKALGVELRAPTPPPPALALEQAATSVAAESSGRTARPRRRAATVGVAAGVLTLGAIALGIAVGTGGESTARRRLVAARDRILVADLENHTHDPLLAGAIGEALRVDLAQSPLIGVLSSQQVRGALGRMERTDAPPLTDSLARELAAREGIEVYLTGAVGSVGQGYVVSAELVSVRDGDVLAAVKETAADSTALLRAVDQVGSALRRHLGESIVAAGTSPPLERVTTRSLEALRRYSEAIRVAELEEDERRAYGLLREAVARDPGFAMAWRKLAVVSANIGELGTAQVASERAFRHRDRLPARERYMVMGRHFTSIDRPDDAIRAYASLLELYPSDVRALFNTGFVYTQKRDFRRAEEYQRRALAADTTIPMIYWSLAVDLLNQGKLDAAATQVRETLKRHPDLERALWLEVDIAVARGDLEAAGRRSRELLGAAPDDHDRQDRGLRTLAILALMQGRIGEAERHLRDLEVVLQREGTAGQRLVLAATRGFVEGWYRRSGNRAIALMERSLAGLRLDTVPPGDRHHAWRGYVYALAGRPSRALSLTAEARRGEPQGIGREAELLRSDGAARLAQNRVNEAVGLLRRSVDGHFCPICSLPDLARAYERAGEPDSAIALYQRYVDTPWSERWSADGEFTGHALLRLGELRERRHDPAGAATAYSRFVQLWHAADPEMQPMVARARARLNVLEPR